MKRQITAILLSFFIISAYAQTGVLYNTNDKLSSNLITQVYADKLGFIWIATWNGLNCYDGYKFRTFKHEHDNENSLADNIVRCILQIENGKFYIGMGRALQTFYHDQFHNIKTTDIDNVVITPYVNCILQRSNKDILIGTSGNGVLRMVNDDEARQDATLTAITTRPRRLMEDKQGQLWILTEDNGLFAIRNSQQHHYFSGSRAFQDIITDDDGTIYVASANGVYRMRTNSSDFEFIEATAGIPASSLCMTREGKLLIGSDPQGVHIYDKRTGTLDRHPYYSNQMDLTHSKVVSATEDALGNIWLGLLQKGVFKQTSTASAFDYMGYKLGNNNSIGNECVLTIFEAHNGTRWVGTDNDGLYAIDHEGNLIRHYAPTDSPTSIPFTVLGMTEDENGRLWVGSFSKGCGWFDPASGQYHRLEFTTEKGQSVFDIKADHNGSLWIGTMGNGLIRYHLETGEVKSFNASDKALQDPNTNALVNDYISQLALSPDRKRVYVGTSLGLACYDIPQNSWVSTFGKNCIVEKKNITDVKEDKNGNVWVGATDGLYLFDKKTRQIKTYTRQQRLADDHVAAIEIDNRGYVWISTSHGLSCLNTGDDTIENFFSGDGLQDNEFSEGTSFMNSEGTLCFGGMGGITWFDHQKMKRQKRHFLVHLIGIDINGRHVVGGMESGSYTITDGSVVNTKKIELAQHDNSFSLQLSTLTFDYPENITYFYSINKEKWIQMPHGTNELSFIHLAPGKYRFRVKAVINSEESDIREFTVIIHPAWYRSKLAYLFYLLLFAALLWWYFRNRKRKEQTQLRMQEHIHASQMSDSRLKMFMNISHELRTPLTLIFAPLETLMRGEKDPHRLSVFNTIKRNASRMMSQLNQMMDLRKIDKGQLHMKMQETDFIAFAADICNLFEHQATSKQITLRFEHEDEQLPVWIDRKHFDKVLVNLLSNAFKFTPSGGHITIHVAKKDGQAVISITDDGIGIPEDKLPRIFDRFYQVPTVGEDHHTGTGIGLDLTKSLVNLHHGTIGVINNASGKGCTFTIELPLGREHLSNDELATEADIKEEKIEIYHQPIGPDEQEEVDEDVRAEGNEDEENADAPTTDFNTGNRKRSIVVVDDDDEIREFLNEQLSKDYNVSTYTNGRDALAAIIQHVPDLIISDYIMPDMDGATLCTKLKGHVNTNHVPIILLTARDSDEDRLSLLELGANTIINKPFNLEILKVTINNLLHNREVLRNKFSGNESAENKITKVTAESPDERLLNRIIAVINKNLSNPDFNVNAIADEVGVSRVHLFRKMKELTNLSPSVFISNIRLKQAAQLLSEQHHSIEEITYLCGFGSPSSFSRKFKSFYGMSPRDYMKEHLSEEGK